MRRKSRRAEKRNSDGAAENYCNRRRAMFIVSAVVVLVVMFAFAAGWHLVVFKDLYARLAIYTRAEPIIPLGLMSMVIQALIFAYIFPIFAAGKPPVPAGLGFGLLMGALMGSIGSAAEAGKQ